MCALCHLAAARVLCAIIPPPPRPRAPFAPWPCDCAQHVKTRLLCRQGSFLIRMIQARVAFAMTVSVTLVCTALVFTRIELL